MESAFPIAYVSNNYANPVHTFLPSPQILPLIVYVNSFPCKQRKQMPSNFGKQNVGIPYVTSYQQSRKVYGRHLV